MEIRTQAQPAFRFPNRQNEKRTGPWHLTVKALNIYYKNGY